MNKYYKLLRHLLQSFKYLSAQKVQNFIILYSTFLFSKRKNFHSGNSLPSFISVEPYNFCQLKCPECPVNQRDKSKIGYLNTDIYKTTVNSLKNKLIHIIFYFQGEPLLNPELPEMIKYAHDSGIYTSTSTNGQILDVTMADKIVHSGLDKIIISMDGSTQEMYQKYRIGGNFEKTINAVTNLIESKTKFHSHTPIVELQFIVLKHNEHQLNNMKVLAKKMGVDRLVFKTAQLYDYENGHPMLTSISKYARYKEVENGKYEIKNPLKNRCLRMWSGAVINSEGQLLPCCFDKNSSYAFGNISNNDFSKIWHNNKASDFRESILKNRKQYEMCRNCTSK